MSLDSQEMKDFMAGMAARHGVDAVIVRPDAKTAWEYDKNGQIIKRDVSPLEVTEEGRRVYCAPKEEGEGSWQCGVYSDEETRLEEFTEQFPD